MKKLLVLAISAVLLAGCASSQLPKQIPETLTAACDLYTEHKPDVIKARAFIVAHWNDKVPGTDKDLIPADYKVWLQKADTYLPQLDAAGVAICAASEGLNAFLVGADNKKINWDQALAVVVKGIGIALDLKQKGVI